MTKKLLTWGGIALLIFFIAYRPSTVGEVFSSLGSTVMDIASGFGDLFTGLLG